MTCQLGEMAWFDLFLVVIGAVLGFLLSIATTVVNKAIDKHGKIHIFYKLVYQSDSGEKAGTVITGDEMCLIIPLYLELQNTSNTASVIRDVCLYLYKNGTSIAKMLQVESSQEKTYRNNEIVDTKTIEYGDVKNSYSFVLPPLSIQKQTCEFSYVIPLSKIEEYQFDEIRFAYYNEKNRIMECLFHKVERGWNNARFNYENKYLELKCNKKKEKVSPPSSHIVY